MQCSGKQAFIIAGTGSGCGKTTVTLGILRALMARGLSVQPFKVGPDYLDTGWHTAVSGVTSRNLDAFMLPPDIHQQDNRAAQLLRHRCTAAIIGVIVNRVNSENHYQLIRHAIERYCGIPVLGRLPVMDDVALPSRHLGLIPAQERGGALSKQPDNSPRWQQLAQQVEAFIDLDRLLTLTSCTQRPVGTPPALPSQALADGLKRWMRTQACSSKSRLSG